MILNGRGLRSFANPNGPNPMKRAQLSHEGIRVDEYVGRLQNGTVAFVPMPSEDQFATYTKEVIANTPYRDEAMDWWRRRPASPQAIPCAPTGPSNT